MAINLISDVMKMASPAVVDRIATAFGVNPSLAQSVLSSAVPAIFAAVGSQASSPSGLANIMDSLSQLSPNLAASLSGPLTGGANNPMISEGQSMLRSVLGAGGLNNIVSSITKTSGVTTATGTGLVALAGQMAMSAIASHASGLDASGVAKLLSSQAGNFSAALPPSLTAALGGAAPATAQSTSYQSTASPSGGTNWLMYLVPALAVAAGIWYFAGMKPSTTDDKPVAQTTQPAPAAPAAPAATAPASVMVDNVDVSKSLTDSLAGLAKALSGITDPASATAAVAKITDASKGIATVSGLASKFTPEQKAAVGTLISGSLPGLTEAIAKVEAVPGVGDVLKPVIGPMMDQLSALQK